MVTWLLANESLTRHARAITGLAQIDPRHRANFNIATSEHKTGQQCGDRVFGEMIMPGCHDVMGSLPTGVGSHASMTMATISYLPGNNFARSNCPAR